MSEYKDNLERNSTQRVRFADAMREDNERMTKRVQDITARTKLKTRTKCAVELTKETGLRWGFV